MLINTYPVVEAEWNQRNSIITIPNTNSTIITEASIITIIEEITFSVLRNMLF
jgi:hypothetical protein